MGVVIVRARYSSFIDDFYLTFFKANEKFYSNKIYARKCYFIECIYNVGPELRLVLSLCGSQISI